MRVLGVLTVGLLGIALAFWVYRGFGVFRQEIGDFAATPDHLNEAARRDASGAAAAGRLVTWQLSDGSRQQAFYLPPRNGAVIVYAHGAPGSASGLLPEALAMAGDGFGSLLLDLPGYGGSEGRRDWGPSFQAAIRRAVDFLVEQPGVDARRIGGFGYSMGGFAMARAAADDPRIAGLVLLASFTNLSDQLHAQFKSRVPGLSYFAIVAARWCGVPVANMDTRAALLGLGSRPVLVIAGKADAAIPGNMAVELRAAAAKGELLIVDGVGHTGFAQQPGLRYFNRLREFWGSTLAGGSAVIVRPP